MGRRVTITRNLTDQHLLLASVLWQVLGLDHYLDPLQMGRQGLAGPGSTLLILNPALADLRGQPLLT